LLLSAFIDFNARDVPVLDGTAPAFASVGALGDPLETTNHS